MGEGGWDSREDSFRGPGRGQHHGQDRGAVRTSRMAGRPAEKSVQPGGIRWRKAETQSLRPDADPTRAFPSKESL